ncbi:response regulator [Aminobacter sp. MDW-2]|uniref:response regulator n=1 Tax=Aminobacter sp. MDW-2 TaxID=2666139 RepID=UPI0012B11DAA|nr:response regulator [Aminobacter sp. MDW-2]MRX37409.1 response regulator [Aminobacter sp. MDW-2]QNH35615.1 response regulator [Aminobacter sp. MDW-2]
MVQFSQPTLKVLIVEDEIFLALDLEFQLIELGMVVVGMADHAERALELARLHTPDLALVDLNLKDGLTGPQIALRLANHHHVLVVFMTATPELIPQDFAGAIGALTKPYEPQTLIRVIDFANAYIHRGAGGALPTAPTQMKLAPSLR